MIRPKHFGFNVETADSNSFQQNIELDEAAEKARAEFDQMVSLLQENNVVVQVFEDIDDPLPDVVFPNNWISHIPQGPLIVYPMFAPLRRKEVRADIIAWAAQELKISQLIRLDHKVEEEQFLEGTGSIVFDHQQRIAYACESPRTNLDVLTELCQAIDYKPVSFESVDLNGGQIYHTNVMMSVGSKVVLICLESIHNFIEREMVRTAIVKSGKEIIELSYTQMNAFAGNAFEIRNTKGELIYVLSKKSTSALNVEQLSDLKKYYHILELDIPTIETLGGGSVRCMMAGLFNYPK